MSFAIIPGGFCTTYLQLWASLYKTTERNKPLMDSCIPGLHSTSHHTASCWVIIARADINQQVIKVVSKHHSGSCISRAFLLLVPDWDHRQPRDFHSVLQKMLQKWWWFEVAGCAASMGGRPAKEAHLKPPIASGIIYLFLRMSRQEFTSSTMQHKLELSKTNVSSGLIIAFLSFQLLILLNL